MSDQDNKPSQPSPKPEPAPHGTPAPEPPKPVPMPHETTPPSPAKPAPVPHETTTPQSPAKSAPVPHETTPPSPAKPAPATNASPPAPAAKQEQMDGRQTLFVNVGKSTGLPCPKCGHVNRSGLLVCANCGTLLINEGQPGGTKRLEIDEQVQESELDPKRNTSTETAEMVIAAMSTAGATTFTENMVLRLEIDGAPTPILLSPKYETTIGRRDPATGTQPDVDLSTYAGYRLGVSRTHAIIRLKDKQLEIYDLGSSNGTTVNGTRLTPHQPYALRDGDEVMLGKMLIRVLFQARNRRK